MPSIFDRMIDPGTGEIDALVVAEAAAVRAASEYGAPTFPPIYLRAAETWCRERAATMRRVWRQQHGLPAEEPVSMVNLPEWGSSGDSFRR